MKSIRQLFLALALVCMSSNSWAILIDVVGDLDTFLSSTDLINSGSASEETWVESVLGVDISYTQLDESISGGDTGNWEQVTNNGADILNHYAFFLGDDSAITHFLVKTGNLAQNERWFLFENEISLDWAYINLQTDDYSITNINKISHVGTVPEPTSLILMGIGLIGLGLSRRKRL